MMHTAMMLLAALPGAAQAMQCNLVTTYDGESKRSVRQVILASNSWQEAEPGQALSELCARTGSDGYHCKLGETTFVATSNNGGPEPSIVHINLRTGAYLDQGYLNGKVIVTRGRCRRG